MTLLDTWKEEGNREESLWRAVDDLASRERTVELSLDDLTFYYKVGENVKSFAVSAFTTEMLKTRDNQLKALIPHPAPGEHLGMIKKEAIDPCLANESFEKCGFMMGLKGKPLYLTGRMKEWMFRKAGIEGARKNSPSLYTVEDLCLSLADKKEKIIAVIKTDDKGNQKAFSCSTKQHNTDPGFLKNLLESLKKERPYGEMNMDSWHLDHNGIRIHLEFPEKAVMTGPAHGLIPGIEITDSETGTGALTFKPTIRFQDCHTYITGEKSSYSHKTASITELRGLSDVKETLDKLMEEADKKAKEILSLQAGTVQLEKMDKIRFLKRAAKELNVHSIIGITRRDTLCRTACHGLPRKSRQSLYDIAAAILIAADGFTDLSEELESRLKAALWELPESLKRTAEKQDPQMFPDKPVELHSDPEGAA